MGKIRVKKGDCFLMMGKTINEQMTLYYITDINGDKLYALSIYVHDTMVQGLVYASEYDNNVPVDAIFLPQDTYHRVKQSMRQFVEETRNYLHAHCNHDNFKVRVGGHYWGRFLETITGIEGNKTQYDLFRFEEENISPCWSGGGFVDDLETYGAEVTDETFNEILHRYRQYVKDLKESLMQYRLLQ